MTFHDASASEDKTLPAICYALYLLAFATGITAIVGLVIAYAQRYSSLSSITAAATAPIFAYVVSGELKLAAAAGLLSIILILRHWTNMRRLWSGTEPKIDSENPKAE